MYEYVYSIVLTRGETAHKVNVTRIHCKVFQFTRPLMIYMHCCQLLIFPNIVSQYVVSWTSNLIVGIVITKQCSYILQGQRFSDIDEIEYILFLLPV